MLITIIHEDGTEREMPLTEPVVRIGRSRECQVFIPDPSMSRVHAEIVRDGEGWRIADCGSKNGTFVNGTRLDRPVPLTEGDRITAGKSQVVFGQATRPTVVIRTEESTTEERTLGSLRIGEAPETALTRILVEAAREIASHRPAEEVLERLLLLAVRATNAERGVIARSGRTPGSALLQPVAACPKGSAPVISRRVLQRVLERGEALSLEDLPDEFAQQGTIMGAGIRSILCAPLGVDRPYRGVLYLDSLVGRADFQPQHLEVIAILAGMADVVLETDAMREQRDRLRRVEAQLSAAAEIQSALLPPAALQTKSGFSAAGYHRACQTVGGDLFDFFQRGDQLGVMLADVSGKGLGAALLMANLHARWHGVRLLGTQPTQWLEKLNDDFQAANPGNKFISMAFGVVDPHRDELLFVSAGHNPALLVVDGNVELLDSTGPILGILPGQTFGATVRAFPRGARLVLYSDGVTDQEDAVGQPFGVERLASVVTACQGLSSPAVLEKIRERLESYAGECPQDDDTTIVVLGRD